MVLDGDEPEIAEHGMIKASPETRKTALVVLGLHESGASAMSRVLSLSGATLPAKFMPTAPQKHLGDPDTDDIAELDGRILADLDSRWDDTFRPHRTGKALISTLRYLEDATNIIRENWAEQPIIVVNEQRMTLLLELWSQALTNQGYHPVYVIMTRPPIEVAESLNKRDGLTHNKSAIVWAKYMLAAEIGTRDSPRVFVRYEDLLKSPDDVLDRIEASLDVTLPRRSWLASTEIDRFLTAEVQGNNSTGKLTRKTIPAIQKYYNYIEGMALGAPANEDASAALRDWFEIVEEAAGPIVASLESDLRTNKKSLEALNLIVAELNERLAINNVAFNERERQLIAEIEQSEVNIAALRGELEQECARLRDAIDATEAESRLHQKAATVHAQEALEAKRRLEHEILRHKTLEEGYGQERSALTTTLAEARRSFHDRIQWIVSQREAERDDFARELREARDQIATLTNLEVEARMALDEQVGQIKTARDAERNRYERELDQARATIKSLTDREEEAHRTLGDRIRELEYESELARLQTAQQMEQTRIYSDALFQTTSELASLSAKSAEIGLDIEQLIQEFPRSLAESQRLSRDLDNQRKLSAELSKALVDSIGGGERTDGSSHKNLLRALWQRLSNIF